MNSDSDITQKATSPTPPKEGLEKQKTLDMNSDSGIAQKATSPTPPKEGLEKQKTLI